jgi:hypothetical protein
VFADRRARALLSQWLGVARAAQRARRQEAAAQQHAEQRLSRCALHAWRAAGAEGARRAAMVRRVARLRGAIYLRHAWESWREAVALQRGQRQRVERAVEMAREELQRKAWRRWRALVEGVRERKAIEARWQKPAKVCGQQGWQEGCPGSGFRACGRVLRSE